MVKKRREKIKRKLDARDLRHVMGIGIAVTRGAASSLSFCYSLLLLTVSRNLITKMKEWAFNQYIPLDSNIIFHKVLISAANRLIGEVVQSRRRPLLGPSPG